MTTNPSHILIARNSRGPNNPSASLSSPTETHAAAAGIFRSSTSQWMLEECETDDLVSELCSDEDDESIEIDEAFTKHSRFPGTVKIVVEGTTFWAHKEILFFASPFFEAALSGNWSETGRPHSMSSVITISQPPTVPGDKSVQDLPTEMIFAPIDTSCEGDDFDVTTETDKAEISENESSDTDSTREIARTRERDSSLAKLEGSEPENQPVTHKIKAANSHSLPIKITPAQATVKHRFKNGPDAIIKLQEERANIFHDLLKFIYPHLECTITWNNVEGLMNISNKLCVPALQRDCLSFLLKSAAGRPIKAMRIAELFDDEELYREASRFVLDNPGGWTEHELNTLSQETLLKLEKRRNWFLERVLKLGLTFISKEYQCCSTCPDSSTCARLLEEKWRQAYHAVFRFGPPQPSMVFRYLRMLEGVSPPLALTQTACQASAKAFTATLFDRMFSLGIRGADPVPTGSRVAATNVAGTTAGPRRHFLYCTLKSDPTHKTKKSRGS